MDGDPPGKELPGNDLSGSKDADGGDGVGAGLPSSIEDAPKEIEPEALTAETELDRFVEGEFKQQDDTFITEVRMVDDSGRGEGVGRRRLTKEDEDLGIYDDTDDGDDLSDSELELERLREEKRKREEEERQEEEHRKEAERKAALEERLRMEREQERELAMKAKTPPDTTIAIFEKPEITPRPDAGASSRTSARSWSDPKFLQGLSLKEIYWRSGGPDQPTVTTSMASQIEHSINASRLALESREAMFRRAMSLLSARCASVRHEAGDGEPALLAGQPPKYFFVTQDKPVPMEPLKAWRGYNGNIYFEPININPLKVDMDETRAKTSLPRTTEHPRAQTSGPRFRPVMGKENRSQDSRSESRLTNKSSDGSRRASMRPLAFLDKQSVFNQFNESIQEDLVLLEGQESTGSLAVRPRTYPDRYSKDKERDMQYNKERIRKGSVAHKLYVENKSKQKPKLTVSGGKFTPPNSLSPLLRTQTQYSLSNQRLTTNSPDPYHLNESKLPPLDQIRASIKHMDSQSGGKGRPYNRPVTMTDDMKPFVKYSHDVKTKFAQQANIC
ncbi:uncharacterized protein LOC128225588 isoform X2 [Mya arenaria]|uniref:uncharacterized protein LOC128225588 isoform X2 n=1 Tax=Mya arenaria TaxID=6604 RepID=UPI0022E5C4C5|nr:uncharacterized protein LOC128225588 isoform X2 [Mya arenaria]